MPSIVGKRRGKQTYYYLVESARVNGKPRIVSQEYLGTAEQVTARLQGAGAGEPDRTQHKKFGDLAAVWGMCQQLQVADIVDEVVGGRRSDAAASVVDLPRLCAAPHRGGRPTGSSWGRIVATGLRSRSAIGGRCP
jgi:hypothetical protein